MSVFSDMPYCEFRFGTSVLEVSFQVARQGGAPGVPRTFSSDMYSDMLKQLSAYSKEPGESGGSAAWRGM